MGSSRNCHPTVIRSGYTDSMRCTEYTLSPELSASLVRAFAPLQMRTYEGLPLAEWLSRQNIEEEQFLPPDIGLSLGNTLESHLALEGGSEGLQLLESLDGIIHGGGAPVLLIHGLPQDSAIGPLIREAFRQRMHIDPQYRFGTQLNLKDKPSPETQHRYEAKGYLHWHHDDANVGLLFGINGGENPRHTELLSLPDFITRVAEQASTYGVEVKPEQVRELLLASIWPLSATPPYTRQPVSMSFDAQRQAAATRLGVVRSGANGKKFGPMIYANAAYDARHPESQPFELLESPFAHFKVRLASPDKSALPDDLAAALKPCLMAMDKILSNIVKSKNGPVLKAGDLLVFNNRLLLHAGGPYVHNNLPQSDLPGLEYSNPRHVVSLDVKMRNEPYSVRPGDRIARPIRMGSVVEIDPSLVL